MLSRQQVITHAHNIVTTLVANVFFLIQCTGGKVYTECGSACPPTCDRPDPVPCSRQCIAGDNI